MIYDCDARRVQLLEEFSPRQFFLKMYLPYFDMFAQGFTPWAPDAKAFTYVADKASFIQEVDVLFFSFSYEYEEERIETSPFIYFNT